MADARLVLVSSVLAALSAGCSRPETPAAPPVRTSTLITTTVPAPPPIPPRVWRAGMMITGGYAGGMRTVSVTEDSRSLRCSPQTQAAVTRAVAEAHPEAWQKGYAPPRPTGLTDQFHYYLTLKADEKMVQVGWSSEGYGLLPSDLRALADALIVAERESRKRCP